MGCGIGYGYLHRIPIRTGPLDAPQESISKEPPKSTTPNPAQPSWASNYQQPTVSFAPVPQPTSQITTSPSQPTVQTSAITPVSFNQSTTPVASPIPAPAYTPPATFAPPSLQSSYSSTSPPPPPTSGQSSSPVNPYSMSSMSQSLPHGTYNWNQSPHPTSLGAATTVQSSNFPPRSGVPTAGVSSGVLPSIPTTATTIAATS